MEEKTLNEKESLEIITRMIQETKNKLEVGDGNMLLLWGYVSVCTAILVYALLLWVQTPQVNWLWFLIPLIGYGVTQKQKRKEANVKPHSSSYVDKISAGIWKSVGIIACLFAAICMAFNIRRVVQYSRGRSRGKLRHLRHTDLYHLGDTFVHPLFYRDDDYPRTYH